MTNSLLDILLTPASASAIAAVLAMCIFFLWKNRRSWSAGIKSIVWAVILLCVGYFVLLTVAAVGFGQAPPPAAPPAT